MLRLLVAPKGIKPLSQAPETCILFVELRSQTLVGEYRLISRLLHRYLRRFLESLIVSFHRRLPP